MKRVWAILTVIALAAAAVVIWQLRSSDRAPSVRRLVLVNFVDHPVLTTIQNETIKGIRAEFNEAELSINTISAGGRVENVPEIGRTLKREAPDLIVTISTPVSMGVFRELPDEQPVVYTFVTSPEALGDDLVRTNSTGLSDAVNYAENLRLIGELFGDETVIGFAYNPNEPNSIAGLEKLETLIAQTKMKLLKATVTSESDVGTTVARLAANADVIYVGGDNTTVGAISTVLRSAEDKKKPVIASDSGSIEAGAVAGVSVDYPAFGRATADVVVRVLKGEAPRSISRETILGTSLIINDEAAAAAGVQIPSAVRARANAVVGAVQTAALEGG